METLWWLLFAIDTVLLSIGFVKYHRGQHRASIALAVICLPIHALLGVGADGATLIANLQIYGVNLSENAEGVARIIPSAGFFAEVFLGLGMILSAILQIPKDQFTRQKADTRSRTSCSSRTA